MGHRSNRLFRCGAERSRRVGVCGCAAARKGRGHARLTGTGSSSASCLRPACPAIGAGGRQVLPHPPWVREEGKGGYRPLPWPFKKPLPCPELSSSPALFLFWGLGGGGAFLRSLLDPCLLQKEGPLSPACAPCALRDLRSAGCWRSLFFLQGDLSICHLGREKAFCVYPSTAPAW